MVTDMPRRFRKRPVEIQAMQWDGANTEQVKAFVGPRQQSGAENPEAVESGEQGFLLAGEVSGSIGYDAVVFDRFHDWIPLTVGDWIVRGVRGEFYPCRADVFAQSYALAPIDRD